VTEPATPVLPTRPMKPLPKTTEELLLQHTEGETAFAQVMGKDGQPTQAAAARMPGFNDSQREYERSNDRWHDGEGRQIQALNLPAAILRDARFANANLPVHPRSLRVQAGNAFGR
jgi:hypothetical protein